MTTASRPRGEITGLVTDIEGSTEQGTRLAPAEYQRVVLEHRQRLRASFEQNAAGPPEISGDGFFVPFAHTSDALRAAIALQQKMSAEAIQASKEGGAWTLQVRCGVYHAAREVEPVGEDGYIDTENSLAHRFASCAVGGQILVNAAAYDSIKHLYKPGDWQDWPHRYVRDFPGPVTLYEYLWDEESRGMKAPLWAPEWLLRETNKFVGRAGYLQKIEGWLDGDRPMLLLHGEGGIGKTRLAAQAVRDFGQRFEGRLYGVALGNLFGNKNPRVTPKQLAAHIAAAVEAPEDVRDSDDAQKVIDYLARRFHREPALLVLDNFESVGNEETLRFLGSLLANARALRCLMTCRRLSELESDTVCIHVKGMETLPHDGSDLETLEAFQLFQARAENYDPKPDLSDRAALGEILEKTDGNALAIELVAARCKNPRLTLRLIADDLKASPMLSVHSESGSVRSGEPYHQNLEACIDWSFQLLPNTERALYPRLSVFPAEFDPAAAQGVASIPENVLDNWIYWDMLKVNPDTRRLFLHPALQEFAESRLAEDDRPPLPVQFAAYYSTLAEQNNNLNDSRQRAVLNTELRNLHAAAEKLCSRSQLPAEEWRNLIVLGNAFQQIPLGLRTENLQQAIACYEAALKVYTLADFPYQFAATQNNLGTAYLYLPSGNRDTNLRQAIACYEATLKVYTLADFPYQFAATQNNLGTAYRNLPSGNRDTNLQKAIACYEAALKVYTLADFPTDWAMTQNNLGTAYLYLPSGNRDTNLKQAIACYEAALKVRTLTDFPTDWAMTQNNLGNAYSDLPSGNRDTNLKQAIACYEAALKVRTLADFPTDWAITIANYGQALHQLGEKDRARVLWQQAVETFRRFGMEHYARQVESWLR